MLDSSPTRSIVRVPSSLGCPLRLLSPCSPEPRFRRAPRPKWRRSLRLRRPLPTTPNRLPNKGTPAPEGEKVKAPKHPIEETIEPLAIKEGGSDCRRAVERALAHMGGERLAATKSLELNARHYCGATGRLVYTERYRTQGKLTWPPVARVTESDRTRSSARPGPR